MGGVGGEVGEGEEEGVAAEHGEEGAGRGEVEVAAAAGEDADGEEAAGLGEEEGGELADEAEAVVGRGVAVEGRAADELRLDVAGGGGDGEGFRCCCCSSWSVCSWE